MASYHLRPVSEVSPSPSPSDSTPGSDGRAHSRLPPSPPPSGSNQARIRRPLSPSSLRDVDLTHDAETPARKYPAPPTGHELMALFPPPPPANFPEMRPGPTSGYFQRQERAFFAQAGKEIVRVRVEVDMQPDSDVEHNKGKSREPATPQSAVAPRPWPAGQLAHPPHASPSLVTASHSAPSPYPPNARSARGPTVGPSTPPFPVPNHIQSNQPPPNLHQPTLHHQGHDLRTPPHDPATGAPGPKVEYQTDDYRDDEAWRLPMPHSERRRAGKHTRRVIVRN